MEWIATLVTGVAASVTQIVLKLMDKDEKKLEKEKAELEKKNLQLENEKLKLENEKSELEKEKLKLEKEKIKNERKENQIKKNKLEKKKKIINKCKNFLINEFTKSILEIKEKFLKEEKWLNSISDTKSQNKINIILNELEFLFDDLFKSEKIKKKLNNKFIDILKITLNQKELMKMNFMIIGSTGVGKSTLINELFEEKLAEEGNGTSCTKNQIKFDSKKFPFLSLYDTVGTEVGNDHSLNVVKKETLEEITQKLDNNDPNEHIHCVLYCTTFNRFVKDELKAILEIRKKYDGKKLPIVIVYTRFTSYNEENSEAIKETINKFLNEHNESISDDIFGITFIKVCSREETINMMGKELYNPCIGLSDLIDTCYKKGKQSYKIAMKNSLIQIGQNSLKKYVTNIFSIISNKIDYFINLNKEFESDFYYYIAYCFEKITDIENQVGIELKENNNNEQFLCIFCFSIPEKPYICEYCEAKACEKCYLNQFINNENVYCSICDSFNSFYPFQSGNKKEINENNILFNNLNIISKNLINLFIEKYKSEIGELFMENFEIFIEKATNRIYFQILEKFTKFINDNNINVPNVMRSKEEIISEATNIIKLDLMEKLEKNYLKTISSKLFINIIEIFKNKMIFKIENYINNLEKNNDVLNFFNSHDIFISDKPLNLEVKFNEYISNLKKRESESQQKAVKALYGSSIFSIPSSK